MEAIFKALARALDQATMVEERLSGTVLSTKGVSSRLRGRPGSHHRVVFGASSDLEKQS